MDRIEEWFAMFFSQVSQMCFDKAREQVEKEREVAHLAPVRQLLVQLTNLVIAERSYVDLGFLSMKNKLFLRKDNSLRSVYESLRIEVHRIEELCSTEKEITAIANELCQYLTARVQLIDLYEKIYVMGIGNKLIRYEELLTQVKAIIEMHAFSLSHLVFAPIKAALSLECEILENLLAAQLDLQSWSFLPSLLHLQAAQTRLMAWEKMLQSRESWKLGFGAAFLKGNQMPAVYQWLVKLKAAVMNKFSLYFHHTLVLQSSPQELRAVYSKHNVDYLHKMHVMQRKYDAATMMLVFDGSDLINWSGPGYQHPERTPEPPQQYTIMVSYPVKLIDHLPAIGKALSERNSELTTADKVIYHFSAQEQCTYCMTTIDPRVTLVVVFNAKKVGQESSITSYINEFCSHLRCNKVFANLKLSSKLSYCYDEFMELATENFIERKFSQ